MGKDDARTTLLNISSNLRRIAQWAYEYPSEARRRNIETFLAETEDFVKQVEMEQVPSNLSDRYQRFVKEFPRLKERWPTAAENHIRRLVWAEEMLTWSNLLG